MSAPDDTDVPRGTSAHADDTDVPRGTSDGDALAPVPGEPRPTAVPDLRHGVLVAAFNIRGDRITPWAPIDPRTMSVEWSPECWTERVAFAVVWDRPADEWVACLVPPRSRALPSSDLNLGIDLRGCFE